VNDGQQFNQYQQREQPSLTLHNGTQKRPGRMALDWNNHNTMAGLNLLMG
jgi:hypothetical protein